MSDLSQVDLDCQLRSALDAPRGRTVQRIQSLWGGYGAIFRFATDEGGGTTYIVKSVRPPARTRRGNTLSDSLGHERKLRSYRVEMAWYQKFASDCPQACRVPRAYYLDSRRDHFLFVLEDLDAAGFVGRRGAASHPEILLCLRHLAAFHVRFLGEPAGELWPVGSYWHLGTRPDELRVLGHKELKNAAPKIDARLNRAGYQTFIHGDAKLENFCFGRDRVAAVDYQYVGRGVGVKDVAYFLSSCFEEEECLTRAEGYVEFYFQELRREMEEQRPEEDAARLEAEWRELYPWAWADFMRFFLGWAPGSALGSYSEKMIRLALDRL